ncbi:MAG: L-threonylcarbamoyladenylate synthase [Rhodospirillales bacterium]
MKSHPASRETIHRAAGLIAAGRLVAFPTETVYGLGANAEKPSAVARIFEAKGRPRFNPLISHLVDLEAARRQGRFTPRAEALADAFWPGPLTLVLPVCETTTICDLARAGLDTVALRVPAHSVARQLLEEAGCPVAAPSANPSERLSPTRANDVLDGLGDAVDMVLDGGACTVGLESTVVQVIGNDAWLLRPGGLALEDLEAVVGTLRLADDDTPDQPRSPGQMRRHYAPQARLRLNAEAAREGEVFLGFGPDGANAEMNLSAKGDLREAAANLFGFLRRLDEQGATAIAVAPIPNKGLGRAINDRLVRAAR